MKDKWGVERSSKTHALVSHIPMKARIPILVVVYVVITPFELLFTFCGVTWQRGLKSAFVETWEVYKSTTEDFCETAKSLWNTNPEDDYLKRFSDREKESNMGKPIPIMCFYKIPKGIGEPPMTFEEFVQRVESVEQEWGSMDGKPRMFDLQTLYEGYFEECKELNCCEVEVKGFSTMSDQVDETFAKIKEKEPDAILIEPEKESNDE